MSTIAAEFQECDTCRAKPGTPLLCSGCLHNREAFTALRERLAAVEAERDEAIRVRDNALHGFADQTADRIEKRKRAEQAETSLAAARERNWQPIETAPKDGTHMLMYRKSTGIDEAWWKGDGWGGRSWWYPQSDQPTHWMPLPEPPDGREGT